MHEIKIPYGLRKGKLVHISEINERGLACNCICPVCNTPLEARKGEIKKEHFAHSNKHNCKGALETILHLVSKEIIASERSITLPAVDISFGYADWETFGTKGECLKPITIYPAKKYKITNIKLEKKIKTITPDLLVYINNRPLLIEIYVTHKIDNLKLQKIKQLGYAAIEIDLSKYKGSFSRSELRDILIDSSKNKTWIYNRKRENYQNKLTKIIDIKKKINRGLALHVDDCPINIRNYKGLSYANITDDCCGCEFCLDVLQSTNSSDMVVICGAENFIKDVDTLTKFII